MPNPPFPLYEPFPDSLQTDPDAGESLPIGQRYSDRVFDLPIAQRFLERLAPEHTHIGPGDSHGFRDAAHRKTAHQLHVFANNPPYEQLMGASQEPEESERALYAPEEVTTKVQSGYVVETSTYYVALSWEMYAYPPPRTVVSWSTFYEAHYQPPSPVPPELTDLPPITDGIPPLDPYAALSPVMSGLVGRAIPYRGQVTAVSLARTSRAGRLNWIPSRPTRGRALLRVAVTRCWLPVTA